MGPPWMRAFTTAAARSKRRPDSRCCARAKPDSAGPSGLGLVGRFRIFKRSASKTSRPRGSASCMSLVLRSSSKASFGEVRGA
eukprot:7666805-Pyramimonas_sp.AAC.1